MELINLNTCAMYFKVETLSTLISNKIALDILQIIGYESSNDKKSDKTEMSDDEDADIIINCLDKLIKTRNIQQMMDMTIRVMRNFIHSDEGIDINVSVRHRICEKFKALILGSSAGEDGSAVGIGASLKTIFSRYKKTYFDGNGIDFVDRFKASVHDQKWAETGGIVNALNWIQSKKYKPVYHRSRKQVECNNNNNNNSNNSYNSDDDIILDINNKYQTENGDIITEIVEKGKLLQENKQQEDDIEEETLDMPCGQHVVNGVTVEFMQEVCVRYKEYYEVFDILYEYLPQNVIKHICKFFAYKEKSKTIKLSCKKSFRGYECAIQDRDPSYQFASKGLNFTYQETREGWMLIHSAKAANAANVIHYFLQNTVWGIERKDIKKHFKGIHKSKHIIYLFLGVYQIFGELYTEPIKSRRTNGQCCQFFSLSSNLICRFIFKNMQNDDAYLVYYSLISNVLNMSHHMVKLDNINLFKYSCDLNYMYCKKNNNEWKIKFVDYGNYYLQHAPEDDVKLFYRIQWQLLILFVVLTNKIFRDISDDVIGKIIFECYSIVIELDKKRGTNKYTSLFFIKHFMELLEKQKGALYKKLIEMMKLIQSGLPGCQKKFKSRLLDRGYDWLFVQVYRVMIKKVMGGNDICEGALGSISSLVIGGGQMLNALEASTLCEWTKNKTMQFLNNENNLQKAANVVFNHKPSIRKLNRTHKEDKRNNLKELYKKKVKESDLIKIKQTCKRNDALYLYKQHISLKYNFGESKKYFLKIYAYQTKEIKKNKTRRTMKRIQNDWINDGLRYFIHVLHKKKDENILLTGRNGTLKKKENKLMKLINKYGFWSMGTNLIFKQIETDILLKLNTDISIFMDSDQEQEEHDRYLDPQLYYLENFTHNV
eukprot:73015_1